MSVDSLGDFLTIIRNGIRVSKRVVRAPYSRVKAEVARILKEEGFIKDFRVETVEGLNYIVLFLKYTEGESVIHEVVRMSKPGRRVYEGYKALDPVIGGLGIAIITTSRGIMTDKAARDAAVGGEVLCTVW